MDEVHIVLASVAVLNIIITILLLAFMLYFFNDELPNSKLPWALSSIKISFAQEFVIIISSLMYSNELHKNYLLASFIILLLIDFLLIYFHLFCASYIYYVTHFVDILCIVTTTNLTLYCCLYDVLLIKYIVY